MYIPKSFAVTEAAMLYQFIRDHNFATLVTHHEGHLTASSVPFLLDADRGLLIAHLARANDQWKHFDGSEALVLFQGPHAYISPTWYETHPSVPTWNYTTVHVYGVPRVIDDETVIQQTLRDLVANHEHGRNPEWQMQVPEDYLHKMMGAIVMFDMKIDRAEGKFKLSQNRSEVDQDSVIAHLANSSAPLEVETAAWMTDLRAKDM